MALSNPLVHVGNLVYLLPVNNVTGYCGLLRQIWDHVAKDTGRTLRSLPFSSLISINSGGDKLHKNLMKQKELCQNKHGKITHKKKQVRKAALVKFFDLLNYLHSLGLYHLRDYKLSQNHHRKVI